MSAYPGTREWMEAGVAHLDVRGLDPPHPLVAILRRVHGLAPDAQLVVHHNRDPVLLYPELDALGWEAVPEDAPPGEVRLRLQAVR